jgi:hypothetical protein
MSNAMILRPTTFDQLARFSEMAASSELMPKDYKGKPGNVMIAVQMGSEIGLAPMQAIQNIAVINGRPAVWGDAMAGLCKAHPNWMGMKEEITGEGDAMKAVCEVHRKGDHPTIREFSVADAKTAGLWGKAGPWQQYPKRMLQMRARGFALRDAFPDALKGLISAEEAQDIPVDTFAGPTIQGSAEPVREDAPKTTRVVEDKAELARRFTDELLAKIAGCADENAVHDLRAAIRTQAVIDRLKAGFPEMEAEVSTAFTTRFNDLALEGIGA